MNSFSLDYQGHINDSITFQLASLMDEALVEGLVEPRTRGAMKVLLVEQLQNIQRYSSLTRQGTVKIGQEDESYFIETINQIPFGARAELGTRLDDLAGSDKDTLRKKFRDALRNPVSSHEHGAGLGLLMLAKKSSRSLAYRFIEAPDAEPVFVLKSFVSQGMIDG